MSKTLSKRFQEITELKLGMKVTAVNIYRVQEDNIGDNKVLSAVAAKEIDLHRLVHVAMTDRLYGKYKGIMWLLSLMMVMFIRYGLQKIVKGNDYDN